MSNRRIELGVETGDLPEGRSLIVDPIIPADAPEGLALGLTYRRIVNRGGACPGCGATAAWPNRAERRRAKRDRKPMHVKIGHDDGCPALLSGYDIRLGGDRHGN